MNSKWLCSGISILASLLLLPLLLSTTGCGAISSAENTGTLEGTVLFWEEDFMPGMPTGTITPVAREVHVYELTTIAQTEPLGPFYSDIHTSLVATTMSDSNGRFRMILPEGTYSLFVREDGQYYANLWLGEFINPVDVVSGATTTVTLDITYLAGF